MFVMLGLRICFQNVARLIESVSPLLVRIMASGLERIAHLRRYLAAADSRAAFFVEIKQFYPSE